MCHRTNIPCYEYFKGKARVNADEKGEQNETKLCVLNHNHQHYTMPQPIPISSISLPSAQFTLFRSHRIRVMWSERARGAHIQLFSEIH